MFEYYNGYESEQFAFIMFPKALLYDKKHFGDLSDSAKLLYSVLLDRTKLSRQNGWFDEHNHVYIFFPIEEICELMKWGENKAGKVLKELDDNNGIGLISRVRRGQGKADLIYVRNFIDKGIRQPDVPIKEIDQWEKSIGEYIIYENPDKEDNAETYEHSEINAPETLNAKFLKFNNQSSETSKVLNIEKQVSETSESKVLETSNASPNNNKINKTECELSSFVHSRARAEPPNADEGMKERKKKTAHLSFSQTLEAIGADWRYMTDEPPNSEKELRDWDDDQRETRECQIPYSLRTDKRAMIYALRFLFCYSYYYSDYPNAERDSFYDILFSAIADMTARDSITVKEQTVSGTEVIDRLNYIIQNSYLFECLKYFKDKWDKVTKEKEISNLKGYLLSCFWEWLTEYVPEEDEDCGEGWC